MLAITIEKLSKRYQLGITHAGSVREMANRCWQRISGGRRATDIDAIAKAHPTRVENDQFWALRNLNMKIEQGDVVGLIGRNGAGKSTLLKILSQITKPTEGRAVIRGRVAALLEVGTGFHPELTGRENVYLNGTILGMSKSAIRKQFDAIVDFAGVETFIDTPVKRYSSGMTVRLGFAVAAHLEPEVLIVDEVLAVGDASFQEKCIGKMSDLGTEGRTILFVSHSMPAIEQLTKKCFVISDGECVFEGSSSDAVDHYLERQKNATSGSSDVTKIPRVSWAGDQTAKIVAAELLGLNNGKLQGSRIRLRLQVEAFQHVPTFGFGITLNYRDGTPVGSLFTDNCGEIALREQRGFELSIEAAGLTSGHYWMNVAIIRNNRESIDVIHEVLHFQVDGSDLLPAGVIEWDPNWGRFRFNAICNPI